MDWTTEIPTVPGWYWAFCNGRWMVIRVALLHPLEQLVPMWGSDIDDWKNFSRWVGPLTEPEYKDAGE